MSTTGIATYHPSNQSGYLRNVGSAGLAFLAALLAMPANADREEQEITEGARFHGLHELYHLAAGFDSVSPSLAAELRSIANRNS